jgi:putative transcriptional regulator
VALDLNKKTCKKMNLDTDFFKIQHNNISPNRGGILISEPFSRDLYFKRSVILLTEHNEFGSVGFVLNKPIEFPINEIIKDFPPFDANISIGGPVKTDTIHYIHTLGKQIPQSLNVYDNIYWGGDFYILKELIAAGKVLRDQVRFFVGYSGWSPHQLENEISKDYWVVTELKAPDVMADNQNIWKYSLKKLGERYKVWINFPENPNLN